MRFAAVWFGLLGTLTVEAAHGNSFRLIKWDDLWADSDLVAMGRVVSAEVLEHEGEQRAIRARLDISISKEDFGHELINIVIYQEHSPVRVGQEGLFFLRKASNNEFVLTDNRRGAFEQVQVFCGSGPLGKNWRKAFAVFSNGEGVMSIPKNILLQSSDCSLENHYVDILSAHETLSLLGK